VVFGQNGKDKVLVTDMVKIKSITNLQMAPDGKHALYLLRTVEPNEENKLEYDYRSQLYLTDFQSIKQLTRGTESVNSPVWSPDARQIAFTRSVKGKSQVFILP
jgi:dipeptidyl aminopeptidase/acylaminoacyl peptidase